MKLTTKILKQIIEEEVAKLSPGPLNETPLHIIQHKKTFRNEIIPALLEYDEIEDRNKIVNDMIDQLKKIVEAGEISEAKEQQDGEVVEKFDSKAEAKAYIKGVGNTAMKIKEKDGKFHVIETE
jgi:hypothetical protein